jgi:hypothetical protein
MAGAPKGNTNAAKPRLWEGAIRRGLAEDREALQKIAKVVIQKAQDGEQWAVTELRNTLDGKPKEHVQVDQNVNVNVGNAENLENAIRAKLPQSVRPTIQ